MTTRRVRGALEQIVLRRLWDAPQPLTGRELQDSFPDEERPAQTTLLTVLTRLERKGLVHRSPGPNGATFAAARSEAAQAATAMASVLGGVHDRHAALLQFAGQLDATDVEALRRALER